MKEMAGDPEGGDGQIIRGQWAEGLIFIHDQALLPPLGPRQIQTLGQKGSDLCFVHVTVLCEDPVDSRNTVFLSFPMSVLDS